ncbi:hypothetical protein AB1Y20_000968 [Prymnesium parvum]|uniref:Mitochondrial carrier protein n=1 Tax=Prymnesium parvum TaxID=97485 RepID=A0AB34K7E7_PRYPA
MPLHVATEFGIGAMTGLLDCCLFHWVDTLKVRRQDGRPLLMDTRTRLPLNRNQLGSPRFALSAIASLYAGFSTNLSLKLPYMAFMFAFNAFNQRLLSSSFGSGADGSASAASKLAAAAMVGFEVSLLLSPLEMVRIQGQNCGKGGLISASRAIARLGDGSVRGWLGVWSRGLTATALREVKYCCGQFFLCDKISQTISGGAGPVSLKHQVVGAVCGGVICTIISHPDDVIKTRMQTHLKGSEKCAHYATYTASARYIVQTEGITALFRGSFFRCLLRVPLGLSVIIVASSWLRAKIDENPRSYASGHR